jgi:hypothetical protein
MRTLRTLAIPMLLGAGPAAAQGAPQITDSAGVRVVVSPAPRANGPTFRLSAEPRVSIGQVEGAPEYQLFQVNAGTVLGGGRIAIVNGGKQEFRLYDGTGKYLSSGGRKGAGPGEFEGIALVGVFAGDSLVFADSRQKRYSVFTSAGEFVRSIPAHAELGIVPGAVGLLSNRRMVVLPRPMPTPIDKTGVARRPQAVVWFDADAGSVRPFAEFPGAQVFEMAPMNAMPLVFGRGLDVTARGDRIAVGNNDAYSVRVYDSAGKLLHVVRQQRDPVPASESDWQNALPPAFRPGAPTPPRPSPFKAAFDQQPHLDSKPLYGNLRFDQAGNLWVQDYKENNFVMDESWQAFDTNGAFIGSLELPTRHTVLDIGADWILLRALDDLDVEHVLLYGLERPGPSR